jgi:hypothetical protein
MTSKCKSIALGVTALLTCLRAIVSLRQQSSRDWFSRFRVLAARKSPSPYAFTTELTLISAKKEETRIYFKPGYVIDMGSEFGFTCLSCETRVMNENRGFTW